jgi:RNA polymerase sigma factor (sigma-70 family)
MQRILPQHNPDQQDRVSAWSEWQERYGEQALAGFVRARNSTRETDEDIIQESLFTAYLGVESGRYQPREGVPFIAYVIGIARNKIREARRRERRLSDLDLDSDEARLPHHASLQRQPERAIERREQIERLWSGIARLPAARRQVLERYLSGASTGEIAGSMAISEELVRQHKCRGLRALARELTGNGAAPTAGVPAAGASNRYPV